MYIRFIPYFIFVLSLYSCSNTNEQKSFVLMYNDQFGPIFQVSYSGNDTLLVRNILHNRYDESQNNYITLNEREKDSINYFLHRICKEDFQNNTSSVGSDEDTYFLTIRSDSILYKSKFYSDKPKNVSEFSNYMYILYRKKPQNTYSKHIPIDSIAFHNLLKRIPNEK